MPKCWILVSRNEQGNIVSFFSPDLNKDFFIDFSINDHTNFRALLKAKLNNYPKLLNKKLKKYSDLKQIAITSKDHWEPIEIEQSKKISVLGRALPITGYIFSLFAIAANAFIAYMALRITGASEDKEDSESYTSLIILATIFRSIVNFFIYAMSNSSQILEKFGEKISNWRNLKDGLAVSTDNIPKSNSCGSSTAIVLASLGATAAITANVSINTIILFQEGIGLTQRYLDLYPKLSVQERELYYELIKWIVVVSGTLAGNYCELAFETSFALELVQKLKNKLNSLQNRNSGGIYRSSNSNIDEIHMHNTLELSSDNIISSITEPPPNTDTINNERTPLMI